jgi:hypothetical protein
MGYQYMSDRDMRVTRDVVSFPPSIFVAVSVDPLVPFIVVNVPDVAGRARVPFVVELNHSLFSFF